METTYEPMIDDIRPIKGIDTSRGTLDISTGIFTPAEKD